jgi:hypothetical protein
MGDDSFAAAMQFAVARLFRGEVFRFDQAKNPRV